MTMIDNILEAEKNMSHPLGSEKDLSEFYDDWYDHPENAHWEKAPGKQVL